MCVLLEKIKRRGEFDDIYNIGNTIFSSDRKIKATYNFAYHKNQPTVKYAVSISSKTGNSVWRNRFKRLVKEAMQKEASSIEDVILGDCNQLSIVFAPGALRQKNNEQLIYKNIKDAVLDILFKIKKPPAKKQMNNRPNINATPNG